MSGAMINKFDIYIAGVGGQGIGLLSEALIRAADAAGLPVRGCDTHGLAQRGGSVSSHVRIGSRCHSPLVSEASADIVVALELHEAVSACRAYLKEGGALVWCDASWQPLAVRLGTARLAVKADVEAAVHLRSGQAFCVHADSVPDPRMQNVAVLAELCKRGLIPGVGIEHARKALIDLMDGPALEANLMLLE